MNNQEFIDTLKKKHLENNKKRLEELNSITKQSLSLEEKMDRKKEENELNEIEKSLGI